MITVNLLLVVLAFICAGAGVFNANFGGQNTELDSPSIGVLLRFYAGAWVDEAS